MRALTVSLGQRIHKMRPSRRFQKERVQRDRRLGQRIHSIHFKIEKKIALQFEKITEEEVR